MTQKATIIDKLPDDLRATIEEDIRSGEFADADDAIRKAILAQHERVELRRSLIDAEAQIERGEFFTPAESQARSAQLLDELKRRNG